MSCSVGWRRYARRASVERISRRADARRGLVGRPAREDALAARRIAGTDGVERPAQVDVVDDRQAVHVLQVEVARVQLERLVRFGGTALEKRDGDVVRAGRHERPRAQSRVDLVGGGRHVLVGQRVVRLAADLRQEHALAVDGDLELVRPLEARHVADDVAHQEHVELVLGVEREVVTNLEPAARAERQALDVHALGEIRRRAVHGRDGRRVGVADGKRRDLCRRRQDTARAATATRAARPRCCRTRSPRRRPARTRPHRPRARAGRARRCRTRCGSAGGSTLGRGPATPARASSSRRSRYATKPSYVSASGRGPPNGGICRPRSLRATSSNSSGCASTASRSTSSRDRSASRPAESWHSRQ